MRKFVVFTAVSVVISLIATAVVRAIMARKSDA